MNGPPAIPESSSPRAGRSPTILWVLLAVGLCLASVGLVVLLLPRRAVEVVEGPTVTARIRWEDATPEEVEESITVPVEARLGAIVDAVTIRSRANDGICVIDVLFASGTGEDAALEAVRSAVDGAGLPDGAAAEVEISGGPGDRIVLLALSGDLAEADILRAAREVGERLSREPGVRRVETIGARREIVFVEVDERAFRRFDIAPGALLAAVRDGLSTEPAGGAPQGATDRTIEDLRSMVIRQVDGAPIYLRDVARIDRSYDAPESAARTEAGPAILLRVVCRAGFDAPLLRGETDGLVKTTGVRCRVWVMDESDDHLVFLQWRTSAGDRLRAFPELARHLAASETVTELIAWASPEEESRAVLRTAGSARAAAPAVRELLTRLPGITLLSDPVPGRDHLTLELDVDDRRDSAASVEDLRILLGRLPDVEFVSPDLAPLNNPEIRLVLDEERAGALGTTRKEVEAEIALRLTGSEVGFVEGTPVVVRIGEGRGSIADLEGIQIQTASGFAPLKSLASFDVASSPGTVRRVSGRRAVKLTLSLSTESDRRDALAEVLRVVGSIEGLDVIRVN